MTDRQAETVTVTAADHTIPQLFKRVVAGWPDIAAQMSRAGGGPFEPRTYQELSKEVERFAAGLQTLGVTRGAHVGLISENRAEWLVADLGILSLGAADVPRGNDSTADELAFILGLPQCAVVIVENEAQLAKVRAVGGSLPHLAHIILFEGPIEETPLPGVSGHTYRDVCTAGTQALAEDTECVSREVAAGTRDEIATIIFTSGTTGEPKGVMLTHANFLFQIERVPEHIATTPGDIWLAVLPVWHSFERFAQYAAVGTATTIAYSKPIGPVMLADMAEVRPRWMASVPRIWEAVRAGIYRSIKAQGGVTELLFTFFVAVGGAHRTLSDMISGRAPDFTPRNRAVDAIIAAVPWLLLYPLKALGSILVFRKIAARFGGRFIAGVSAGGALPAAVDRFFGAAGILLLEGYGLTETAPVLSVRSQMRPVPGTVGRMLRGSECRILSEEGAELPPGTMGVIHVRGPQVMQGYFERPELTSAVLTADGWLNTGDLGMVSHSGDIRITGRAKDTIVLLGGENIEPIPIEQKLQESDFITRAVVVGQDQKYLGALICPDIAALERFAADNHVPYDTTENLLEEPPIREMIDGEVSTLVSARTGFKGFEQIYRTALIPDDFEIGRELSAKQEIKRHVIAERYENEIAALFR